MPLLSDARIDEIYDKLPQYVVALDEDPATRGPVYLNGLIAKVRGYINDVGVYLQEVLRAKSRLESELHRLSSAFEIESNELMATNEKVSSLPSAQDRTAMVNVLLRDKYREILSKRQEVNDSGYLLKAIQHRHRELEQTMSAIRLQRSLVQTSVTIGAGYGNDSSDIQDSWQGETTGHEIDDILSEMSVPSLADAPKELPSKDVVASPVVAGPPVEEPKTQITETKEPKRTRTKKVDPKKNSKPSDSDVALYDFGDILGDASEAEAVKTPSPSVQSEEVQTSAPELEDDAEIIETFLTGTTETDPKEVADDGFDEFGDLLDLV